LPGQGHDSIPNSDDAKNTAVDHAFPCELTMPPKKHGRRQDRTTARNRSCIGNKVGRRANPRPDWPIRKTLKRGVDRALVHHDALRRVWDRSRFDRAGLIDALKEIAPSVLEYAAPGWKVLTKSAKRQAYPFEVHRAPLESISEPILS